ncbi:histidine phosphatase superfamily [Phellopilus nigrolimitatus]|nr:histidine phosphatase superfamily [Phellopilus nigrolimitatus]
MGITTVTFVCIQASHFIFISSLTNVTAFYSQVRHGESTDNLRTVWAGWEDAPLSNHGAHIYSQQSKAAGAYFASTDTRFTAIYASPLKRAHSTAQAILAAQPEPKPSFLVSPDVREQHFGVAEGKPWSLRSDKGLSRAELYAKGVYPILYDRDEKFPGGESLTDLQGRAERAMEEIVMPYVRTSSRSEENSHLAIVSHGLCISELIAALVRKDRGEQVGGVVGNYTGLMNTAWTRLSIEVIGLKEGQAVDADQPDPSPLRVKVIQHNQRSHLDGIKRQLGGIGSAAHDPAQKDIRAFFGGGAVSPSKGEEITRPTESEEGRAVSNVYDEVESLADGKS